MIFWSEYKKYALSHTRFCVLQCVYVRKSALPDLPFYEQFSRSSHGSSNRTVTIFIRTAMFCEDKKM